MSEKHIHSVVHVEGHGFQTYVLSPLRYVHTDQDRVLHRGQEVTSLYETV